MAETLIHRSKPKLIGRIAITLAIMVTIPLTMQPAEGRPWSHVLFGWALTVLCAVLAAGSIRAWFDRRPVLVLDERGVSGPGLDCADFVPWTAIHSVARSDRLRRGVLITVDDRRLDPATRAAMGVRQENRDQEGRLCVRINVVELAINRDALGRLIAEGARAAEHAAAAPA